MEEAEHGKEPGEGQSTGSGLEMVLLWEAVQMMGDTGEESTSFRQSSKTISPCDCNIPLVQGRYYNDPSHAIPLCAIPLVQGYNPSLPWPCDRPDTPVICVRFR